MSRHLPVAPAARDPCPRGPRSVLAYWDWPEPVVRRLRRCYCCWRCRWMSCVRHGTPASPLTTTQTQQGSQWRTSPTRLNWASYWDLQYQQAYTQVRKFLWSFFSFPLFISHSSHLPIHQFLSILLACLPKYRNILFSSFYSVVFWMWW